MPSSDNFWTEASERHREIARTFYQNIEIHGARGYYECDYDGIGGHCPWCATNVKYLEYTGPRVVNIVSGASDAGRLER